MLGRLKAQRGDLQKGAVARDGPGSPGSAERKIAPLKSSTAVSREAPGGRERQGAQRRDVEVAQHGCRRRTRRCAPADATNDAVGGKRRARKTSNEQFNRATGADETEGKLGGREGGRASGRKGGKVRDGGIGGQMHRGTEEEIK